MRVFLLEDEAVRIGVFLRILGAHTDPGDVIHHATDVDSALRVWEPPYDLLLLDHDLGGQQMAESHEYNTGYQFLVRVHEQVGRTLAIVHSWNPSGAWALVSLLRSIGAIPARHAFDPQTFELLLPHYIHSIKVRNGERREVDAQA